MGFSGPVDDELLGDRVLRGQRRGMEGRSADRPLQPVVDAATRTSSSRRLCVRATATSTPTAPRTDGRVRRMCPASPRRDILDLTKYEYYSKGTAGGWFGFGATPAGWYKNNPPRPRRCSARTQGPAESPTRATRSARCRCSTTSTLKKYVVLYGDQFNNIVMRTSDTARRAPGRRRRC